LCRLAPRSPSPSLSLHDALPILSSTQPIQIPTQKSKAPVVFGAVLALLVVGGGAWAALGGGEKPTDEVTPAASASARGDDVTPTDRKSTRLNSSHVKISYAVFCF